MLTATFHSGFLRRAAMCGIALLTLSTLTGATASAQVARPFGGRVVAHWDNIFAALPAPVGAGSASFLGTGQMRHMGRTIQAGQLTLGFPDQFGIAQGSGSVTITAANGDAISFNFTGSLNSNTGEGTGPLVITGGTGRFAGATGSGHFYALIDLSAPANQRMTVLLDGVIVY